MIKAQQMHSRVVEVVDVNRLLCNLLRDIVCCSMHVSTVNAAAGQSAGESLLDVITSVLLTDICG